MFLEEKIDNLFNYEKEYYLAHCISADAGVNPFAMGAGIVVQFNSRYNMKNKMREYAKINTIKIGDAILIGNTFNLISKPTVYSKPTYDTLRSSIKKLRSHCEKNNINKLAIPTIGCGIDGLNWIKVREIIEEEFKDLDINILVCFYNQKEWNKWH